MSQRVEESFFGARVEESFFCLVVCLVGV
eukprot:SAG31_NODE_19360_length_604_cov_3.510891_2_plen_28_part_01